MNRDLINPTATMEWIVNRLILTTDASAKSAGLDAHLQPGWDITSDIRCVDDPGVGIYRAPHLLSNAAETRGQGIEQVILATGMTINEIEAGLYRQARVFPTPDRWRWDLGILSKRDCFSVATDAGDYDERSDIRDEYLIPFLGVTIEDLAICAADWSANDPQLAQQMMSKSFSAFGESEQLLATRVWPKPCIERFQQAGMTRVLPPVLAFVAHAALSQAAQTHGAQSLAGYLSSGKQVTATSIINDLPTRKHAQEHRATRLFASSAFLQSLPLAVKEPHDLASADGWGDNLVAKAMEQVGVDGTIDVPTFNDRRLGAMIHHHPALLSRATKKRRPMLTNRPILHWQGLTEGESAAVNLTIIMNQVKAWFAQYGHAILADPGKLTKPRAIAWKPRAVAVIRLAWLETSNRSAFVEEARLILLQKEKASNPKTEGNKVLGATEDFERARVEAFHQKIALMAVASTAESMDDEDFGDSLWRRGETLREAGIGAVGHPGWQNFAHPHLWLRDDASQLATIEGLAAWTHGLAEKSLGRGAPDGVVAAMTVKGGGAANSKRRSSRKGVSTALKEQKIAARAFQVLGLMLTPQSTDPMLRVLVIRQLAKHEESSQTEKLQT